MVKLLLENEADPKNPILIVPDGVTLEFKEDKNKELQTIDK